MSFIAKPLGDLTNWITSHTKKRVYLFNEGSSSDAILLGNKGVSLCEMTRLALPVPPGFIITTEAALEYLDGNQTIPEHLISEYVRAVQEVERKSGKLFGATETDFPLLLAIRAGAAVTLRAQNTKSIVPTRHAQFSLPESWCIPGVMGTVLNIGMNDAICKNLGEKAGTRFALDTYIRHMISFGTVVLGANPQEYFELIEDVEPSEASGFTVDDLQGIVEKLKRVRSIPSDPYEQLRMTIEAIYTTWFNKDAIKYRQALDLPSRMGTAISIQSMVFGNKSHHSGTGFCFSRNPSTGEKGLVGEFAFNAEGDEVVKSSRKNLSISQLADIEPQIVKELQFILRKLEVNYRDMQNIEFAVEDGAVRVLQAQSGKRTAKASVKIAVDMVAEDMLTERTALMRIDTEKMDFFSHAELDPAVCLPQDRLLAVGYPSSHGAVSGKIVFCREDVERLVAEGHRVIFCTRTVSTSDVPFIKLCAGLVTLEGSLNSEDAVLCRGLGKVCVSGVERVNLGAMVSGEEGQDRVQMVLQFPNKPPIVTGDDITIDGSSGLIYAGIVSTVNAALDRDFQTVVSWADSYRRLRVHAIVEGVSDMRQAVEERADGIGCLVSDGMFSSDSHRKNLMLMMLLADTEAERKPFFDEMLKLQKQDLKQIFRTFAKKRVCVRLLDGPLQKFLLEAIEGEGAIEKLALRINGQVSKIRVKLQEVQDANPVMGLRGCRISIMFPWITDLQVQAIVGAGVEAAREGETVFPEIAIPMISSDHELQAVINTIHNSAKKVFADYGAPGLTDAPVLYSIGVMMDTPRSCLKAQSLCDNVSFHAFDAINLTQFTYGLDHQDSLKYMPQYMRECRFKNDPFVEIDDRGIGRLVQLAMESSRDESSSLRNGLILGHQCDAKSVKFLHKLGLDFIACSPASIPAVKIAAAQANIASMSKRFLFEDVLLMEEEPFGYLV